MKITQRILLVDNYDSFTYNLYHYLQQPNVFVEVIRTDLVDFSIINDFDKIILSPGPGVPLDSLNMMRIIGEYYKIKPMLGVCLGMQAIGQFFNAELYNQNSVKHGVSLEIRIDEGGVLFEHLPNKFEVGLYHSWAIRAVKKPLRVTAVSKEGVVMAIEHEKLPIYGVQFHPESILTSNGKELITNFVNI